MKKITPIIAAVVGLIASAQAQIDLNKTMIVVNGTSIKADNYFRRMEILPNVGRVTEGRFQPATPGYLTLQALINEILMIQLAEERKVAPTAAQIQEELDAKVAVTPELLQIVKLAGLTEADLRHDIRVQLSEFNVITQGINITDQEVETYYKGNLPNYTFPKRWKVRVIVVTTDAKMKQVDDLLKAGRPFAEVARDHSEDITRIDGGMLGNIAEEQMGPNVKEPIMALQKGQMTGWTSGTGTTKAKYLAEDVLPSEVLPLDASLRRDIRRTLMLDRGRNRNNIFKLMSDFRKKARFEFQGTPFDKQLKQALEGA